MSIENRESILEGLNNNLSFSKISMLINKDRTTISKEIKKHRILHESKDPLRKNALNSIHVLLQDFAPMSIVIINYAKPVINALLSVLILY